MRQTRILRRSAIALAAHALAACGTLPGSPRSAADMAAVPEVPDRAAYDAVCVHDVGLIATLMTRNAAQG